MNVLIVYHLEKPDGKATFGDATLDYMDITDKEKRTGQYDVVYCDCLEVLEPNAVPTAIQNLYSLVALKGELWLLTGSYEFAAQQAYVDNPHVALHHVLYGPTSSPHRSCFTLMWLRALVEEAGMILRQAHQEQVKIRNKDSETTIPMNLVIGWKYTIPDPAEAIN